MDDLVVRTLAGEIAALLTARGETICVSESSSGGLISAALLSVPGASRFYIGAAVIYTKPAFAGLLAIPREARAGIRSATPAYAALIADHLRGQVKASWGLAETGAAGPDGNAYGDLAGHCCLAIAGPITEKRILATGLTDRWTNMGLFAQAGLELLRDTVQSAALSSPKQ
jgi:PncC family amidohydrolase